jgi:uncharacterized protein (TIRG00374 family)
VIAERVTDLLALVLLTALGSLVLEGGAWIAIAGGALVGLALFAIAFRPLGEVMLRAAAHMPVVSRIAPRLREAYESLGVLVRPGILASATALATLSWGLECVALWIVVRGFEGASIGAAGATLAYSASTIAGALAMLPGGLGVTEAGMAGLVEAVGSGMTPAIATASTLLVRLATLWWAVLIGAIALGIHRSRAARTGPA